MTQADFKSLERPYFTVPKALHSFMESIFFSFCSDKNIKFELITNVNHRADLKHATLTEI